MNKGGFLRILEAFIAVMLIAGVMSFIYIRQTDKPDIEEEVRQLEKVILEEISNDQDLRKIVLGIDVNTQIGTDKQTLTDRIDSMVKIDYHVKFKICELNDICEYADAPKDKKIISEEVSISSALERPNSPEYKKIKLFMWKKD